jgi:UDP-4-amino-4,6-dideoxy-N-acetyl-beta-L-altrosamine N-acetyltransferase
VRKPNLVMVRLMTESDTQQVLLWRNHPEIRRYMFSQNEISVEEHACWFKTLSKQLGRHLLIFEISGRPLGFINLNQLKNSLTAEWGFYLDPDAPLGTGRIFGKAVLSYAFETIGLHKICCQVLGFNERSIRFHLNLGFQREGVLRQQHFDGQAYHEVVCLGILSQEWDKLK